MDPLDREKPWSALGQIALIALTMGVIYLILRFAVVVPEWGWQLIAATTLVGVFLYYNLAFRAGFRKPLKPKLTPMQKFLRFMTAALLLIALALPLVIVGYNVWSGGQLWK